MGFTLRRKRAEKFGFSALMMMRENPEQDSDYYAGPRTKLVCTKCREMDQEQIVKIPYHNHFAIPERRIREMIDKDRNFACRDKLISAEGNKIPDEGYYRIWCKTCEHGKDQTEMIWMKLAK